MKLVERLWATVTYAAHLLSFSSTYDVHVQQQPIQLLSDSPTAASPASHSAIFTPPGPQSIECNYKKLDDGGWESCNSRDNRACWLKHRNGSVIDIHTNYEKVFLRTGVTRRYELDVTNKTINADGFPMHEAKVFNDIYPGPWSQACWGDDIETLMDGVNGVTQCPIPPGGNMTYRFSTTQYGTSWYHSHYSLQYGDGLLGPLTIHGPTSARWDDSKEPTLLTDWGHRSAFQEFQDELDGSRPKTNSILLNGRGNWTNPNNMTGIEPPALHREMFEKDKVYLMRIINTAVDTTFIFSIDNHNFTIVGSDFVPLHPYSDNSVLVGIGQRYHIIVNATPIDNSAPPPRDGNFWMRATPAARCQSFAGTTDDKVGIVTYAGSEPLDVPNSVANKFDIKCSDETYSSLKPIIPWTIGRPANSQGKSMFEAGLTIPSTDSRVVLPHGGFVRWSLGDHPMWLNMAQPTMMNIGKYDNVEKLWDPEVVLLDMEYKETDWVYMIITATSTAFKGRLRQFVPAAHPIHLHGHDFALLAQSDKPYWESMVDLKFDNPPRRDVVLLPANGYVVIAFKADNPGAWLLHCHIAMHASSGLALQVLERQNDLQKTYLPAHNDSSGRLVPQGPLNGEWNRTRDQCRDWRDWHNNANNWWDMDLFQDDSAI